MGRLDKLTICTLSAAHLIPGGLTVFYSSCVCMFPRNVIYLRCSCFVCAGSETRQFWQGSHSWSERDHRGLHQNKQGREVGQKNTGSIMLFIQCCGLSRRLHSTWRHYKRTSEIYFLILLYACNSIELINNWTFTCIIRSLAGNCL